MINAGKQLRKLRLEYGDSAKTLARETGIPYRTILQYETAEIIEPSMYKFYIIAKYYGVSLDYFIPQKRKD